MAQRRRRTFLRDVAGALAVGTAGCGGRDLGARTAAPQATGDGGADGETGGPAGGGSDGPSASGDDPATDAGAARIAAEAVATGFTSPVGMAVAEGLDRTFVVDQPGRVFVVDEAGRREAAFLDVRDRVVDVDGYDERGLLGIALHPEFADNGRLFLRYSAPRREGTPSEYSHTFVLAEFEVDPEDDAADPSTERSVLEIPQPQSNHNAGAIAFGPDGYLYVAVGDGGGANDAGAGHVADWYDGNEGGNGQDVTENLLGSVLRIDVDEAVEGGTEGGRAAGGARAYGVPPDNPLVGSGGLDEQFAWGFRNPWRMSFDGGDLYVADVGQNRYEEVNLVEKGGNYGWNVREGAHCFRASSCPAETPAGDPLRDPIVEYSQSEEDPPGGVAVVGGYRYRGEALPALRGRYVFADWRAGGRLFAAEPADEGRWPIDVIEVGARENDAFGRFVLAFGLDAGGELYVFTTRRRGVEGSTGALHRLRPAD